ncbi:hypothetical protein DPEC_G00339410 [Dallia pectoralis]|uniref:Uncharacterized protein n=1 Tax=Dallia pectoralis TaxID=75939 RepID=A0ACC2F519_DALPE|nr:hypothetical protein DPEC_G00339410 [Dallia pectoralis]
MCGSWNNISLSHQFHRRLVAVVRSVITSGGDFSVLLTCCLTACSLRDPGAFGGLKGPILYAEQTELRGQRSLRWLCDGRGFIGDFGATLPGAASRFTGCSGRVALRQNGARLAAPPVSGSCGCAAVLVYKYRRTI